MAETARRVVNVRHPRHLSGAVCRRWVSEIEEDVSPRRGLAARFYLAR